MTLGEILRVIRRQYLVILAVAAVIVTSGYAAAVLTTPAYIARAQVLAVVSDTEQGSAGLEPVIFIQSRIPELTSFAQTRSFLQRVVETFRLPMTVDELSNSLSMSSPHETSLIDVSVRSSSPIVAADASNAAAQELAEVIQEREGLLPIRATVTEAAEVPQSPASPEVLRIVVQSLVVGLIFGLAVAMGRAQLAPKGTLAGTQ